MKSKINNRKIEKTLKILSYKDIRKEPAFHYPRKLEENGSLLSLRFQIFRLKYQIRQRFQNFFHNIKNRQYEKTKLILHNLRHGQNTENGSLYKGLNPKHETLNPKQYRNPKSKILKPIFGILNLINLNLFRISNFDIRIWKSKVFLKKTFALLTIVAVIVTAYFQNTPQTQSATNYWVQTDWSGGAI